MTMVMITLGVFAIVFSGMAIGVILSNKAIKGSCGGIGALMGDDSKACDICAMKNKCKDTGRELCEE
jgi:hypothetical protein